MSESWEQKYLSLSEEHRQQQEKLEIFRRGLISLSLSAESFDEQLDHSSQKFRDLLREKELTAVDLKDTFDEINSRLDLFEDRKTEAKNALPGLLLRFTEHILLSSSLPLSNQQPLLQIRRTLQQSSPRLLDAVSLIQEIVEHAISPADTGQETGDQPETAATLMAQNLAELLDTIPAPEKFTPQYNQLKQELSAPRNKEQLKRSTRKFVTYIADILSDNQNEFGSYLQHLADQLSHLSRQVIPDQSAHQEARAIDERLSQKLTRGFNLIHEQMLKEQAVDVLKDNVQEELSHIETAIQTFNSERQDYENRYNNRLESLSQEIESLRQQHEEALRRLKEQSLLASTDRLTGLPNRASWETRFAEELSRASRYEQSLSMAIADVDFFKKINDQYGHLAGDKVLKVLAGKLQAHLRQSDFIARYGGEEFVILLPHTSADSAVAAMNKIREKISRSKFQFRGSPVQITMSFGVAEFRAGQTAAELFSSADEALYAAKGNGRNQVVQH